MACLAPGWPRSWPRWGLGERGGDAFRGYSLGMKQRLGIAAALLPGPELLILDEPANGLDPAGIAEIRRLLRLLTAEGMTVFISSHLLAEVEAMCDHLVMIHAGRLVFQGDVAELLAAQSPELLARPEHGADLGRLLGLVETTGRTAQVVDDTVQLAAGADWAGELNRLAMGAGITLVHLSERRPGLEEAFFALTGTVAGDVGPIGAEAMAAGR